MCLFSLDSFVNKFPCKNTKFNQKEFYCKKKRKRKKQFTNQRAVDFGYEPKVCSEERGEVVFIVKVLPKSPLRSMYAYKG